MLDPREEPLTVPEMAAYLRRSAYTIREYAKHDVIPAHKIGGSWRFYLSEFHAARTAAATDSWAAPKSKRRVA